MYARDRKDAFNEAYKRAGLVLRMRNSNDVAAFSLSARNEGFNVSRTQSHAEDPWRWFGVDISDHAGRIASLKFGALVEGPSISWGWSLECGDASSNPPSFEPADVGADGPLPGQVSRKFRQTLDFCRKQVRPT